MVEHDVFAATEASGYGPVEAAEPERVILDALRAARPWVFLVALAIVLGGLVSGAFGATMVTMSLDEEFAEDAELHRIVLGTGAHFLLMALGCFSVAAGVARYGVLTSAVSLEGAAAALRRASSMWRTVALLSFTMATLTGSGFVLLVAIAFFES